MTPRLMVESARLAGPPLLRCQSDARLVDLVRAGNERAFEAIVDRYRRPLLRYCARLLSQARAEDAVQQTFMNAYAAMRPGDADLDLRPWLYRIARNACLNALRENGWSHEQIEKLRRGTESAHEVVERRSELREVIAAVHTLPARQREAVVLRELEGRSYDQIARELDSSEGAVRQLLNRARTTLRAGATALTPIAVLVRLSWLNHQPAVAQVSEAAGQEAVRSGAARLGGVVAASVALAVGAAEAPRHLFGDPGLRHSLSDPESLARLSASPPLPPGGELRTSSPGITLTSATTAPVLARPRQVLRAAASIAPTDRVLRTRLARKSVPVIARVPPPASDRGDRPRGGGGDRRGGRPHRSGGRRFYAQRRWRRARQRASWTLRARGRLQARARRRTARRHVAAIARHRRQDQAAARRGRSRGHSRGRSAGADGGHKARGKSPGRGHGAHRRPDKSEHRSQRGDGPGKERRRKGKKR